MRAIILLKKIQEVLLYHRIPNTSLILLVEDAVFRKTELGQKAGKKRIPPIMSWAKDEDIPNIFYIVDDYTIGIGKDRRYSTYGYWTGWTEWTRHYLEANNRYPY